MASMPDILLDFKMQISPSGEIYSSFYWKTTTKNLFMHFKSALPLSAKTNYIRNEIKRIHNRCTEEKDKSTQIAHFLNTPPKKRLSNINHTTFKL